MGEVGKYLIFGHFKQITKASSNKFGSYAKIIIITIK